MRSKKRNSVGRLPDSSTFLPAFKYIHLYNKYLTISSLWGAVVGAEDIGVKKTNCSPYP